MHPGSRKVVVRRENPAVASAQTGADERQRAESPLLRLRRSWNARKRSTEAVGAVSAASVLVLAIVLGLVPLVSVAIVLAFALGLAAARLFAQRRERSDATVAGLLAANRRLEEQLLQAQRLELLGKLAAGVAHDFNNLLAVISGYAARLSSPLPRDAREESGVAIGAAAERGASLVRQLLAFSRPQPADSRVVDLNDLVREFAPMLRRVIGEDVELELRLDAHRLPVDVHPVQIDQVLMNIAVNARDAMPDGGTLTIGTWKLDGSAVVTMADTGAGMEARVQERIFEPFFSTKEPTRGSGLGLATAHSIIRRAGGSIAVSSRLGEGTTFTFGVPLSAADAAGLPEAVTDATAPDGGPETVLVVEDEPSLRELEQLMLEDAGYAVLTAANAAEALLVAGENAVELLLVDVVMPGMSGPQLVAELAARGCVVPTVYVSGYGSDEMSSRGLMNGRTTVLEKPFAPEVLLRRLREVLDGASYGACDRKSAASRMANSAEG